MTEPVDGQPNEDAAAASPRADGFVPDVTTDADVGAVTELMDGRPNEDTATDSARADTFAPDARDGKDAVCEPSISGVVPTRAFVARTTDIQISGYGTTWTSAAKVDFGTGVRVNSFNVASPTAIIANITVDDTDPGVRDVSVTEGTSVAKFEKGFAVISPIALTVRGTEAQGSVLKIDVKNLDVANSPFDTTATGDGFFTSLVYTNIETVTSPAIKTVTLKSVALDVVSLEVYTDVGQTAGDTNMTILSGPVGGTRVSFPLRKALNIAARQATVLGGASAVTFRPTLDFESGLFSYTPTFTSSAAIVDVKGTSTSTGASLNLLHLGKSGRWTDFLGKGSSVTYVATASDMNYFVAVDTKGAKNYSATMSATTMPAAMFHVLGTNTSTSTPQAITSTPAIPMGGQLDTDVKHVFSVVVDTPQVNRKLEVVTAGGDLYTDTVIAVYGPDGKMFGSETRDSGHYDSYISPEITVKGTYMVVIKASKYFDPTYSKYLGIIRFQ